MKDPLVGTWRLALTMPFFQLFGSPHTGHLIWKRV